MDWAYYPELKDTFNGYYSKDNVYGKPYKLFVLLCVTDVALSFFSRSFVAVYSKLFVGALVFVYGLKNFLDFSSCSYSIDCPVLKPGLYLMFVSSCLLFIFCFFSPKYAPKK